jgi:hypothetical protein
MKFARVVFTLAGVWGFLVLTPLWFLFDVVGERYPPPITHADFYYGFVGVTLVWQLAFLIIATDPARYRPIMLAAILEKVVFVAAMAVLLGAGHIVIGQFAVAVPDLARGLLFVAAFLKTPAYRP